MPRFVRTALNALRRAGDFPLSCPAPAQSAAIFLGSFSRGLYAGSRKDQASDIERRRTGRLLRIGPGDEQPLTVSWRTRAGGGDAARIEYGAGSLPVP